MRNTSVNRRVWVGALGIMLTAGLAIGDDIRWIADAGGDFDDVLNWEGGVVPGSRDAVFFDLPGIYSVMFTQDQIVQSSFFREGTVTLDLTGFTFTCSNQVGEEIHIGDRAGDDATLKIMNGTVLYRINCFVGREPGSKGHLILTGPDTLLSFSEFSSNRLSLGRFGAGFLEILDGAIANVYDVPAGVTDGAEGHILIDGVGSELNADDNVSVGMNGGIGSVTVQNGGLLNIDGDSAIHVGGGGEALVTGAGTQLNAQEISIFGTNGGRFTLADGAGLFFTKEVLVGEFGGYGEFIVTGAGTTVDGSGVRLGDRNNGGTGRLEISDGAHYDANGSVLSAVGLGSSLEISGAGTQVSTTRMFVADDATFLIGGGAEVRMNNSFDYNIQSGLITDAGTYFECGSFEVAATTGDVSMTIQNGAVVSTLADVIIQDGTRTSLVAELTVAGIDTAVDVGRTLKVGLKEGSGILNITDGATVVATDVIIGPKGVVNGEITIRGDGVGPQFPTAGLVAATFQAEEGAFLSDTNIVVQAGGTLTGDGVLSTNVQNDGGRMAPGVEGHQLTIDGRYAQATAAAMRVRMIGWYDWDQLHVLSDVSLAGGLEIEVPKVGQWTPPFGRVYRFLTADSISGTFSSVVTNSPEIDFEMTYGADFVEFKVIQTLKLEVENLVAGQTARFTVSQGTPGWVTAVLYGVKKGGLELNAGDWCVLFGFDIPANQALKRIVVSGAFNQDGIFSGTKRIPGGVRGLNIFLQAAQKDTCPARIMSNVIEQVIG